MKSFALWCVRWRFAVVGVWILALAGLAVGAFGVGSKFTTSTDLPHSESSTASSLLMQQSDPAKPHAKVNTGTIAWHSDGVPIDSAGVKQAASVMLGEVKGLPGVASVASPYESPAQLNVKANTAYATVTVTDGTDPAVIIQTAEHLRGPTIDVQVGGTAFDEVPALSPITEAIGILAALLVLLLVFRSLWAALLPIITGVAGVGVSLMLAILASHVMDLDTNSLTMGALIGLGVGIDYALFIVNRFRKALMTGASVPESISRSLNTSGRAVIFAGLTVMIALLGMFVVNLGILTGMSRVAAATVLVTVLAAITLLPALLGILGHRILSKKQRAELASHALGDPPLPDPHPRAASWVSFIQRRPRLLGGAGLLLIVAMAFPALSVRVGDSDASSSPTGSATHEHYTMMADGFGAGYDSTLQLVGRTPDAESQAAFKALAVELQSVPGVASVTATTQAATGQPISVVTVEPTTSAQTEQTTDLVKTLRDQVIPRAESGTDLQVYVGGKTAIAIDLAAALTSKLPLYLGLIALLGFLLLTVAFRSIVLPLIATVSNLATILVSLGAITVFFQWGWATKLLGVGGAAPIQYIAPTLIVGIMFGLSMDYQVFLGSRVSEEWHHTRDNTRAVKVGVTQTALVIAAAATIMFAIFASFGFSGQRIIAMIGIGLTVGVLVDAFIIRMTIMPALMLLLGKRIWYFPKWADRLTPNISLEGPPTPEPAGAEPQPEKLLVGSRQP